MAGSEPRTASSAEAPELVAWGASLQNATRTGLHDSEQEGTFVWSLGDGTSSELPAYRPAFTAENTEGDDRTVVLTPWSDADHFHLLTCTDHYRSYTCTPL